MKQGSFIISEEAANDPLAKGIFEIAGVVSVFYMDKFVTIEKSKDTNWGQIQKPFINFLKTFDQSSSTRGKRT